VTRNSTIYVKWVRSGIGFSRRQKNMIRALGLSRLNQVVERPDTPQTRGLVTALAHLVEVVRPVERPAWASLPEYAIRPRKRTVVAPATEEGPAPEKGKGKEIAAAPISPGISESAPEIPAAGEPAPAAVPQPGSTPSE
jgi:large subunit ribosomal protein L30